MVPRKVTSLAKAFPFPCSNGLPSPNQHRLELCQMILQKILNVASGNDPEEAHPHRSLFHALFRAFGSGTDGEGKPNFAQIARSRDR
jgi:hypothetical protein